VKQTKRISKATKEQLVAFAALYETKDFINGDPSWFMHQVDGTLNKETIAFIAACLSYGSRKVFMPRIQFLLNCAKENPYEWIRQGIFRQDIPDNDACFYRLYTNHTMYVFFVALEKMLNTFGSIKNYIKCYVNEKERNSETKIEAIVAIEALCTFFAEQQVIGIVPKNTSSSCKRICMFLRWLVRNNSSVDLGIWHDFINKQSLIIPLDTHVLQQANRLKLLNTTSTTMSVARRLTDVLLKIFPDDPLKGDFALFGYGVNL
jgi:hypothetical protein